MAYVKGNVPWIIGKHHSEETKRKISQANEGKKSWNKGKHFSSESRKKMSQSQKGLHIGSKNTMWGKHHTDEAREKMRNARLGKNPWNKGKHGIYSNETIKKISEATKRLWKDEAWVKKVPHVGMTSSHINPAKAGGIPHGTKV